MLNAVGTLMFNFVFVSKENRNFRQKNKQTKRKKKKDQKTE